MQNSDRKEFLNVINKMAIIYEKNFSADFLDVYWDILQPYSVVELKDAMNEVCRTCKFYPKPSEIIELIESKRKPKIRIEAVAQQQWRLVLATLGRGDFNDPVTAMLCKRQFNYNYLRNMLEKDENWEEKRFCNAYELAAETYQNNPQIEDMSDMVKQLSGKVLKSMTKPDNREQRIAELREQSQGMLKEA